MQRPSWREQGGYTPLIDLGIEVSNAVVQAEDVGQLSRERTGDRAGNELLAFRTKKGAKSRYALVIGPGREQNVRLRSAAIGLPVPVERLV